MRNRNLPNLRVEISNHLISRLTRLIPSDFLPERRRITIGQAEYEVPAEFEVPGNTRSHSEWVRTGLCAGRNTVVYKNTTASIISSVSLIADSSNGSLKFFIDAAGGATNEAAFRRFVRSANLPIVDGVLFRHCAAYISLPFYSSTDDVINSVMSLIERIEPTFITTKDKIFSLVNNYRERYSRNPNAILNEEFTHFQSRNHEQRNYFGRSQRVPEINQLVTELFHEHSSVRRERSNDNNHRFFSTSVTQSTQLPPQGSNAKILSQRENFDTNSIPEEFCCPLSGEIMDDPVYDPLNPQYKFERKWIEISLQKKAENPYTRTSLAKTQLIADEQLKNRISDYIQQVCSQDNFCGLKRGFLK